MVVELEQRCMHIVLSAGIVQCPGLTAIHKLAENQSLTKLSTSFQRQLPVLVQDPAVMLR